MRTKLWNDWGFCKLGLEEGKALEPHDLAPERYEPVTLPHDWLIFNTEALYEDSVGFYRRELDLHQATPDEQFKLIFEGVYQDSSVYINGKLVKEWKYGYSSFSADLTPHIQPGTNTIDVKVVHEAPNSRWYSGAGIHRPVWLQRKPKLHFALDGIYAYSEVSLGEIPGMNHVRLEVQAELAGWANDEEARYLEIELRDHEHKLVAEQRIAVHSDRPELSLNLQDVRLWGPSDPYRYTLELVLYEGEHQLDREHIRLGFRHIRMEANEGFFINGDYLRLHGMCQHHDLGLLGAAYHTAAARRQLEILMEAGVNAIRTAHNMPAPDLLDLCDELGLIVINEAFDMWRLPKTDYDYARFFDEWSARDVASWIRRDRNHPSVIMWSLGNEIYDTEANEDGLETLRYLKREVQKHDPKGHAVPTLGSNYMFGQLTQRAMDELKIVGYNYSEKLYPEHHDLYPDWKIYGAETGSAVHSRGIYHFPLELKLLSDEDLQCSSLGNSSTSWGTPDLAYLFEQEAQMPFSLGQFVWTGTDYIGEPTPYHTKNSYFGQVDTAGFPKDSYYHFQAAWTDAETAPMVHLFPHWDWNPGQIIDMQAVSNASAVELFLNGESQGRRELSQAEGKIVAHWKVAYASGEITCAAYNASGEVVADDRLASFGNAQGLRVDAYPEELGPEDLLFIEISAVDSQGRPVANANNRVGIRLEGPVQLLGMDNGDSTDYDPYKTWHRRLFSGKLLAMVQPTGTGEIRVQLESPGLEGADLSCRVTNPLNKPFEPMQPAVQLSDEAVPSDHSIRKLELTTDADFTITPERATLTVRANPQPAHYDDKRILWQVTDERGVPSPQVRLTVDPEHPLEAILKVSGDGRFVVRAMPYNGKSHAAFISTLTFDASGFGAQLLDPYSFLSASLHTHSDGEITNGNDRGIASHREGVSWVAFSGLDFGPEGSDEVLIPVFSFSDATHFRLWAGLPHEEGSEIVYDDIYELPRIWNTYQDFTFQLSRPLRGNDIFALELNSKAHIKGFQFKRPQRAYRELLALEADAIYGDSFERTASTIAGIGNNVSLVYRELDFGTDGATRLLIRGRTPLQSNAITVIAEDTQSGERTRTQLTFAGSVEEQIFDIEPIHGQTDISFVFLPGSNFDFEAFRFIPEEESP